MAESTLTVQGVVAFEERSDGVTVYLIKLSNGDVLKKRYKEIAAMFKALPAADVKRLQMTIPGKTGFRAATLEEKNQRLNAFDKVMKQIAGEPSLVQSKAFQAFLVQDKGKDLGDKLAKKFGKIHRKEFKITEVASFDSFFEKVAAPLDTVCELSDSIATAHETLSELFQESFVIAAGVANGDMKALFEYYFSEMQKASGKFKLKLSDNGEPKLKIKGSHAKHVVKFVEAIEVLVEAVVGFVTTAPDLIEQLVDLGNECAEFPQRIKDEAMGMNPLKIPGATKKLLDNVKYLGGVPGEFKEAMTNIQEFLGMIQTCAEATFGTDEISD
jgi:hypothetical protein